MKLEMTELGPVKRAMKIEVPEEVVNKEFDKVYASLRRQAHIPGFRPGKAPIAMLEKRYARMVEQDVVQRLVPDYYQRAIKEAGIQPVLVEIPPLERIKVKRNAAFTFTATVEIKLQIELRDYRPPNPISLKQDSRTVTDEQVEQALLVLREQQGQLDAAPPDSTLAEGLYAIVAIEGFLDDVTVEGTKKEGHLHKVGSKTPLLGLEIDEQLLGKSAGQIIEIPQPYPATHPDERLAGKTVVFRVTIEAVKQQKLPELDDEFAKDCGPYESLEQLRTTLRTQLEEALQREIHGTYKDTIIERLLHTHHFELPEPLVEREVRTMIRQKLLAEHRHNTWGSEMEKQLKLQEDVERLQEESLPEAKRRVKIGLILEAIAEKEGLTVDNQEIEAEITKLANGLKLPIEEVYRMIDAGGENSREEFRERILAEKALELVYQFAVIQG